VISVIFAVSGLFVLSLVVNVILFVKIRKKPKRPLSIEAEELLSDLTAGASLVRVTPIDPRHVFFRSVK
jgi:hypothetical protein